MHCYRLQYNKYKRIYLLQSLYVSSQSLRSRSSMLVSTFSLRLVVFIHEHRFCFSDLDFGCTGLVHRLSDAVIAQTQDGL